MPRIRFGPEGKDYCAICYIAGAASAPEDLIASGIALGSTSAVVAQSPAEINELFAQMCPTHQQRINQFIGVFSQMAGVDYRQVFARLGARPAGPPPEGTVLHLTLEGSVRTVCGRHVEAQWPDNERFVYPDKIHLVNCSACKTQARGASQ